MKQDTIASKVGRPPKFKTPLELAEIADKYFAWCETNPIETSKRKLVGAKQTGKGSEAKSDETVFTTRRAYTLDGFCLFANISDWNAMKKTKKYQTREFLGVIHAIEATIRDQQVSGALAGVFNANIVARLNGLADVQRQEIDDQRKQTAGEAIAAILGVEVAQIENR